MNNELHSEQAPPPAPTPGADRRGRLKAMGVIQIVIGGLCTLFFLFSLLAVLVGNAMSAQLGGGGNQNLGATLASVSLYAMGAIFFFVIGIGSLKLRRWTRPLILSFMWPGLIIGVGTFLAGFFVMPAFFEAMPIPNGPNPVLRQTILSAVQTGMLVFFFIAGVLIPGLHVLVFQPRSTKETLETFDTAERFTDKCPTPVFGITVSILSIGIMQLLSIGVGIVVFFGLVLTGPAAAALLVVELIACLAIAHFVFRSRIEGWWGSLVFLLYLSARNGVTFLTVDFLDILRKSGTLDAQTESVMEAAFSGMPIGTISAAFWAAAGLSAVGYLLYAKKYFR